MTRHSESGVTAVRRTSRAVIAGLWAVAALGANAQSGDIEFEAGADPLSCLVSVRPESKMPAYPSDVPVGTEAVVRVRLKFSSSDQAPTVDVSFNNAGPAFAATVRDHVANYRLPCLPSGSSVAGEQEFQFVVKNSTPETLRSIPRGAEGGPPWPPECLSAIKNAAPPGMPPYTAAAANVLVRLKFEAPDTAPDMEVIYNGGDRRMAEAVRKSVMAYRMGCMKPGEKPVVATQQFNFEFTGEDTARLKPELTLVQLLGLVKDLERQKARFDFTTMGCPFRLRFSPLRPYAENGVRELGETNAGRREFVEWLRKVTLAIPAASMKTAIGSVTTVSVPCVLLDLS